LGQEQGELQSGSFCPVRKLFSPAEISSSVSPSASDLGLSFKEE
jgi:hypothetical protein